MDFPTLFPQIIFLPKRIHSHINLGNTIKAKERQITGEKKVKDVEVKETTAIISSLAKLNEKTLLFFCL